MVSEPPWHGALDWVQRQSVPQFRAAPWDNGSFHTSPNGAQSSAGPYASSHLLIAAALSADLASVLRIRFSGLKNREN